MCFHQNCLANFLYNPCRAKWPENPPECDSCKIVCLTDLGIASRSCLLWGSIKKRTPSNKLKLDWSNINSLARAVSSGTAPVSIKHMHAASSGSSLWDCAMDLELESVHGYINLRCIRSIYCDSSYQTHWCPGKGICITVSTSRFVTNVQVKLN